MCAVYLFFFFFKQKTAYEMRISDWSSDVCSSDLHGRRSDSIAPEAIRQPHTADRTPPIKTEGGITMTRKINRRQFAAGAVAGSALLAGSAPFSIVRAQSKKLKLGEIGRAACRARGGQYG